MNSFWNIVLAFVIAAILALIVGAGVYYVWNLIVPELFNFKEITYTQAVGLYILCQLLFGDTSVKIK